jgi:hypothetical protein
MCLGRPIHRAIEPSALGLRVPPVADPVALALLQPAPAQSRNGTHVELEVDVVEAKVARDTEGRAAGRRRGTER